VISALADTGVPVARAHLLCADDSVIGQMFYLMDAVPGRILIDASMPEQTPAERTAIFDSMNDVLARLHQVDPAKVGLGDYGPHRPLHRPPGRALEQAICRAQDRRHPGHGQAHGVAARAHPVRGSHHHRAWRLPAGKPDRASHRARIVAVLDWELSTLGHPLCDVAYNCLAIIFPSHHTLRQGRFGRLGLPTEEAYVAAYCRRAGRNTIEHWNYYLAFSLFRLAAIAQGVYRRGLQGNSSNPESIKMSTAARERAELAWSLVQ